MPDLEPMAVVDVGHPSWAKLTDDRQAYHKWLTWLGREDLDPNALRKIEIYDSGSPFDGGRMWARTYGPKGETAEVPLSTLPPVHVLCIPGIWHTWPAETWPSEVWREGQAP